MILDVILALIVLLTLQFNISKRTSIVSPLMVDYMTINQKNESEKLTIYQGIELQICNYAHVEIPSVLDPIVMDAVNSVHSFGLFPRAPRFLLQRIAGSVYEIATFVPLPEISKKMSVACMVICIQSINNDLSFLLGNR